MFFSCCSGSVITILLVVIYKFLDWLIRRFYIGKYSERYILVTGCDTGFGNLLAKRLDTLGCHVFAGCLTETGETELRKTCSNKLQTISLDVCKPDSVKHAFETVKQALPDGKGLWGVLNNAGVTGPFGPPDWLSLKHFHSVADVNLFGLIDVTMTFLPLVKKERGRVVNMSSVAGRVASTMFVAYCVSKYGVEAFTDGLRRAMQPFGVEAALIEPGFFRTNFILAQKQHAQALNKCWAELPSDVREEYGEDYLKHQLAEELGTMIKFSSGRVDLVVDAYEHALLGRYPRARYVVGAGAKLFIPLSWLPEWMSDWIVRTVVFKGPLPAAAAKKHH